MIKNQEMELAIGEPIDIYGFKDGEPRACYPCKLKELKELNLYLSRIDEHDLVRCISDETSYAALTWLFQKMFLLENKKELKNFMNNIDTENYPEIISDIKKVNGVENEEKSKTSDSEKTNWLTAVSSIAVYTSTPVSEVKNLTLLQFNSLLEVVNKKIMFEYKYTTVGLSEDPSEYIQATDYPLKSEDSEEPKKHTTVQDVIDIASL